MRWSTNSKQKPPPTTKRWYASFFPVGRTVITWSSLTTTTVVATPPCAALQVSRYYNHSSQTRKLLRLTPAAFLMLFTRTFHLKRTMWARAKALWIFGVRANSQFYATLVRWFNRLRAPIMRRESDARINSFPTRTRLTSSKRQWPIRSVRRVGVVALLTRP